MDGTITASRGRHRAPAWILMAVTILLAASLAAAEGPVTRHLAKQIPPPGGNYEGPTPESHTTEAVINLGVDPVGTFTEPSVTFDCGPCYLGYGTERWDFTVTVPTDITVEVSDCCVEGDRFEARCNNRSLDEDADGDLNNHEEDCIFGREDVNVPVGTFANLGTVTLDPGDWTVRIRDVQFQCGTVNPGCGAGYTMRISFGPPSGTTCAGIPSCFDPGNPFGLPASCADESLPRDEPVDMIEAKLDALEPQIVALEQKLDLLQIQSDNIIIALEMIEAKLDDPGPTPCDQSDPATCDGLCPDPNEVCTVTAVGCMCELPPPPCDQSDPDTCDGVCPDPNDVCVSDPPGGPCVCQTPCDQADPATCDGLCPDPNDVCTVTAVGCMCEPPPPPPCDLSDPATCDGACPNPDEVCTPDPTGCRCAVPCEASDPATCDGTCPDPSAEVCTLDAAAQQCFCEPIQGGFCNGPTPCSPCALGTICPDGTPCDQIPGCP